MALMELLVCASVGAVPVFVLLRIRKTLPMRRVVLVIKLLMELLVLQMIIKVVKEALVLGWIMGKCRSSGRTEDQCRCNEHRSSHVRFPGWDGFGAQHRFHDALLRRPSWGRGYNGDFRTRIPYTPGDDRGKALRLAQISK
jgi:hypothetical protein